MDTNINFTNDLNGESDVKTSFNLPRKIYNLTAGRAVADGAIVVESESCTYETMLNIDRTRLLNEASLLLLPNTYKESKLYSHKPLNGNGDFTVTRATTATRVNSSGLVDLVPYNLNSYSEMFADASWTKAACSITANTVIAPDGTLTADTLSIGIDASSQRHRCYQSRLFEAGVAYTYSVYVKQNQFTWIQIVSQNTAFDVNAWCNFDLQNGVIGNSGGNYTSQTITSVGNGWWRISVTATATITANSNIEIIVPTNDTNTGRYPTWQSLSAVDCYYIWGAQTVEGTLTRNYLRTETRLNIPRLDYSLGSCPNILLEPQRTNLALQSSSFDNASWGKANTTATANTAISPSGIMDADTYTANGSSSVKQIFATLLLSASTNYTLSIYAKKDTNNFIQFLSSSNAFGGAFYANFDLQNGVIGQYTGTLSAPKITDVGNGWYRCEVSVVSVASPTSGAAMSISLITSATSPRAESNTLSTSVFLWGAQLEAGAYATSYIPTTTASVTRNFDYIIRNNLVTNGIVSATQGTWFIEIRNNLPFLRDNSTSCLNFGMDGNNCIRFRSTGSGRISVEKNVGGVLTTLVSGLSTTQTMKIAFKWNGSEVETFMNGVQQTPGNKTYPSTIIPQTLTTNFTNTNFGVPMTINEMAFFPNQLTDSQLIALTT